MIVDIIMGELNTLDAKAKERRRSDEKIPRDDNGRGSKKSQDGP
jgi:hypothetical protein